MTRDEIIEWLVEFDRPLTGPWIFAGCASPPEWWDGDIMNVMECMDTAMRKWAADAEWSDLDTLLDIVANPPDLAALRIDSGDWSLYLGRTLEAWAWTHDDQSRLLDAIGPHLDSPVGRDVLISTITCLTDPSVLPLLKGLAERPDLTEDDFIEIADGFYSAGGTEGGSLLLGLCERVPPAMEKARTWLAEKIAERQRLREVAQRDYLTERDFEDLAQEFFFTGGDDRCRMLMDLRKRVPPGMAHVLPQIDLRLELAGCHALPAGAGQLGDAIPPEPTGDGPARSVGDSC